MKRKQLIIAMEDTFTELLHLVDSFDQKQINVAPFEGSWSAGQVTKHLIMSNAGFADMLNGKVKRTERAPDMMVEGIKRTFMDFDIKMESPDFVVPPAITYLKEDLLRALKDIKTRLIQAIQTLDLTNTCLGFEFPVLGYLTRLEAAHFVIYHTKRHIHQLRNINREIKAVNSQLP